MIISSSPVEVVEPLAEFLGADEAIGTRAEVDADGNYTGELEFYSYGEYKAEAIRELAALENIDLDASYAYSDSVTDLPMLELVGHPVAVNPDKDLVREAKEREWEIRVFARPVRLRDRVPVPPKGPTIAVGRDARRRRRGCRGVVAAPAPPTAADDGRPPPPARHALTAGVAAEHGGGVSRANGARQRANARGPGIPARSERAHGNTERARAEPGHETVDPDAGTTAGDGPVIRPRGPSWPRRRRSQPG